jgi:hypothetical protein
VKKKPKEPPLDDFSLFEINPYNLHEEWFKHPKRVAVYAKKLADARQAHSRAESDLEVIEAELKRDIRKKPAEFDVDKITEDVVKSTVLLQPRYQWGLAEVIRTKHVVDTLTGFMSALENRKKGLENAVTLLGMDFFSVPHLPRSVDHIKADKAAMRLAKENRQSKEIARTRPLDEE